MPGTSSRDRFYAAPPQAHSIAMQYGWSPTATTPGMPTTTGLWTPLSVNPDGTLNINLSGIAFSGELNVENNVSITGQTIPLYVTGNFSNPIGVTGINLDAPSGYTGGRFLSVGGRAVNSDTFMPQYTSGGNAETNFDKDNGGLLVNQGCLNKDIDNVTVWYSGGAVANNTSLGSFGTNTPTNGILFNANSSRTELFIQAMGTGIPTYVKFGDPASAQSFSILLNPATAAGRAGDSFRDERWRGFVYVSGGAVSAFEI